MGSLGYFFPFLFFLFCFGKKGVQGVAYTAGLFLGVPYLSFCTVPFDQGIRFLLFPFLYIPLKAQIRGFVPAFHLKPKTAYHIVECTT